MLLIPLRDSRVLVHVLDDVSPTDTGVVSTERNLAFLRAVRDDAHFSATEIVVEEILEPHTCDEQEVPAIRTALSDIFLAAIAARKISESAVRIAGTSCSSQVCGSRISSTTISVALKCASSRTARRKARFLSVLTTPVSVGETSSRTCTRTRLSRSGIRSMAGTRFLQVARTSS